MALSKNWPPGQGIADDAARGFYIQLCVQRSSAIQEKYSTILNVDCLEQGGGSPWVWVSTSLPAKLSPCSAGCVRCQPSNCCTGYHSFRRRPNCRWAVPACQVAHRGRCGSSCRP